MKISQFTVIITQPKSDFHQLICIIQSTDISLLLYKTKNISDIGVKLTKDILGVSVEYVTKDIPGICCIETALILCLQTVNFVIC